MVYKDAKGEEHVDLVYKEPNCTAVEVQVPAKGN